MKRRLVVLTEIIAPYRIPVFNALAEREDVDLHVIFLSETDTSMRQWKVYTDEILFSYEVLPSWRKRLGKYNILVNQSVTGALERAQPEVIVCGGYNYLASWQAQRWAKRNGVQFLLWCESTAGDQRGGRRLVESLKENFLRGCDGFVVPGRSSLEYLRQMVPPSRPIFVAPNAVDVNLFAAGEKAARARAERLRGELGVPRRYFLFVGRMVRTKGVLDLLQAYGSLSAELRSEVGLVFAGEGPLRAECEADARSIFPGAVHFAGFVHRDELAGYYGLAECFVFPTHSDPWGLVVNEAMACGLPVICSRVAGCAADLVRGNGRIVKEQDVRQLAMAMHEIATDAELRQRMSRESRELIQKYSPQACAAGLAEAAVPGFSGREDGGEVLMVPPRGEVARAKAAE
jgi:glycosyltransferase involved in cell wall biosynthesis